MCRLRCRSLLPQFEMVLLKQCRLGTSQFAMPIGGERAGLRQAQGERIQVQRCRIS
jgi:hypothetical protein